MKADRVHTISYTGIDSPGGVPRFNRSIHRMLKEEGCDARHWCWDDVPSITGHPAPPVFHEDDRARYLSRALLSSGLISRDDVVIGDGFWCGDLSAFGFKRVISVAHGIWGHVTQKDILAKKQPDNPRLHVAQVQHRLSHASRGLPIVSVSRFISDEIERQIGVSSRVINNSIDMSEIPPLEETDLSANNLYIVHGINDAGNVNKGWDHIEECKRRHPWASFYSLDSFHQKLGFSDKMQTLQHADCVIIPSGYEGNSYFMLETLSCDVPIICYDVGLAYEIRALGLNIGVIGDRDNRSPEYTADMLANWLVSSSACSPRDVVQMVAPFEKFRYEWLKEIDNVCR